jgi:hypothetical protein
MMIDILDRHQDRHQEGKHVVVAENIDIVVDIHHHQLHGLPIQAHRLIVHVRHQVVHIEDIDVDDHVSFQFFLFFYFKFQSLFDL